MLKREWSAESNGKLPHLFIPSKTVTVVLEFVVEDLLLGRTAALVPEFAVKHLPLGRTLDDDDIEENLERYEQTKWKGRQNDTYLKQAISIIRPQVDVVKMKRGK